MNRRRFFGLVAGLVATVAAPPKSAIPIRMRRLPSPKSKYYAATLSKKEWLELDALIMSLARTKLRSWGPALATPIPTGILREWKEPS